MSCPAGFTLEATMAGLSPTSRPKTVASATAETMQLGDQYYFYGEDIIWTKHHLRPSQLEPLRKIGDDLSDNALEALKIKRDDDVYDALMDYVSKPESEQESSAPRLLLEEMTRVPDWVDWDQVYRGQQVFWKYFPPITIILVYNSIINALALPGMSKVLLSTGYITGQNAFNRIIETGQFLIDTARSPESLNPGEGAGWKAALQVRILHSHVRTRLQRLGKAHSKYYDIEKHGIAINQEDMLVNLFSLSSAVYNIMETRLGVTMTKQEKEDHLHLWRYVGYLSGCPEETLALLPSVEVASATRQSLSLHLVDPDADTSRVCASVLKVLAGRPIVSEAVETLGGILDPFKTHVALSECVMSEDAWEMLGLPPVPWRYKVVRQLFFKVMAVDIWLASLSVRWQDIRRYYIVEWHRVLFDQMILERKSRLSSQPSSKVGGEAIRGVWIIGLLVFVAIISKVISVM